MSQPVLRKVVLGFLATALWGTSAFAQPGQPPPGYGAPPTSYGAPPPNYPPPGYGAPYGGQVGVVPHPGTHRHDGFYLRLQLGPGYTSMTADTAGGEITVKGGGVGLSLAIGGAIAENLIAFGHLVGDTAIDPTVEVGGASGTANGSAGLSGMGIGLAYFVMPVNLYLSASVLATQISISDDDGDRIGESKLGIGADLSIGKEWWVSDNWGLGLAAQFMAARMKDKETILGTTPTWTAVGFTIALSATFN